MTSFVKPPSPLKERGLNLKREARPLLDSPHWGKRYVRKLVTLISYVLAIGQDIIFKLAPNLLY